MVNDRPEADGKVLLYSGGMDSVALAELWDPDVLLHVDMGTRYAAQERKVLPPGTTVVSMPLTEWEREAAIIPARNVMLATIASQYGSTIAFAATSGDRIADKDAEFAARTSHLLTYVWQPAWWTPGKTVEVVLPVKHLSKRQLIEQVRERSGDAGVARVAASFSCYTPHAFTGTPCGACKACARKWVAFAAAGLGHAVPDAEPWVRSELLPELAGAATPDEGGGSLGRGDETLDVLVALGATEPITDPGQVARDLLNGG